jgi:hypothetical protein
VLSYGRKRVLLDDGVHSLGEVIQTKELHRQANDEQSWTIFTVVVALQDCVVAQIMVYEALLEKRERIVPVYTVECKE